MSDLEDEIKKINAALDILKPYAEWTHNYSHTQAVLLKMAALDTKNVIEFWHQGTVPIKFYIPKALVDHVQRYYLETEKFWDQDSLLALEPFIKNKAVVDVGANVGNHAIYWGLVAEATSVQAFEPILETFIILEKNIKLNGLGRLIKAHRCALGAQNGTGDPTSHAENRMQSTVQARTDGQGAIRVRTLDSFKLTAVDFIKIDVEGHTIDMLRGSTSTFERFKPSIYVELFPHEGNTCKQFLENIGYIFLGSIEEYNYVFCHSSKTAEANAFRGIIKGEWPF